MKKLHLFLTALFVGLLSLTAQQDFEFPRDLSKFGLGSNLKFDMSGPYLKFEARGLDSYFLSPALNLDPAQVGRLAIEYRASGFPTGKTNGEIFFLTPTGDNYSEQRFLQLPSLECDGEWHTLYVSASRSRDGGKAWREAGTITKIRFDLVNQYPGNVEIRKISFLPDLPPLPTATSADIWDLSGGKYSGVRNLDVDTTGEFLKLNVTKGDCCIISPAISLDPLKFGRMALTYRATGFTGMETTGELFYLNTNNKTYSEKFYIPLPPLDCDGEWHTLTVSANHDCQDGGKAWRESGEITNFRLDIVNQYPGTIEIKDLEFLPDLPELVCDPSPRAWDFTQGFQDWTPTGWEKADCGPEGFVGHCLKGQTAMLVSPRIHADTKEFNMLRLVMRTNSSVLLRIERARTMRQFDQTCPYKQIVHQSDDFLVYDIPVDVPIVGPRWTGTLEKFRVIVMAPEDGQWEIKRIEFFKQEENRLAFACASPYLPQYPTNWEPQDAESKVEFLSKVPENFRLYGKWRNTRATLPFPSSLQIAGSAKGESSFTLQLLDVHGNLLTEETRKLKATADWQKFHYTFPEPELAASAILLLDGEFETPRLAENNNIIRKKIDPASSVVHWKANWIWHEGWFNKDNHTIWFRRNFQVDDLEQVDKALLEICADDRFTLQINGETLKKPTPMGFSTNRSYKSPSVFDLKPVLKQGTNQIFVKVDQVVSSSGLLLEAVVCSKDKELVHLATDETWECSVTEDEGSWTKPLIIGNPPCQPWGDILFIPIGLLPKMECQVTNLPSSVKPGDELTVNLHLKLLDPTDSAILPQLKLISEDGKTVLWASSEDDCQKIPAKCPAGSIMKNLSTLKIPTYLPKMETTLEISFLGGDNSQPTKCPLHIDGPAERDYPKAEMRKQNDVVSLYVNGKFSSLNQGLVIDSGGSQARNLGAGNTPIADVEMTPILGLTENGIDYLPFNQQLADYLNGRPDQNLMLCLQVSGHHFQWYMKKHPEICAIKENGSDSVGGYAGGSYELWESMGSEGYRQFFGGLVRDVIAYYRKSPFASRIVGVHFGGGVSTEWFLPGSQANDLIDYSEAGVKDFRRYLRAIYPSNEALQAAWHQPDVTFDNAPVPSNKDRRSPAMGYFFDPATQRHVIDYNRYQHHLDAETLDMFAEITKRESDNRLIVGAYYSYCVNLAEAYIGFCQGSGHFDADYLYSKGHIDYFCAPTNYSWRLMGEPTAVMGLPHGYALHNMVWLDQADFRTHWQPVRGFGRTESLEETISSYRREFGRAISQGTYIQWYDFSFGWTFGDARLCQELKHLQELEYKYRPLSRPVDCQNTMLVVLDERQIGRSNIDLPIYDGELIRSQCMYLSLAGIPFRIVFFKDLQDFPELLQHQTMLMLNLHYLNDADVEFLRDKILTPGRTVAFVGPVALLNDDKVQPERASELLGIPLKFEQKLLNLNTTIAPDNPLCKQLAGHKFGTIPSKFYNPNLLPQPAEGLQVLGNLTNDASQPSLVLRPGDQEHCQLLYSLAPGLSPEILRELAKLGGMKILSTSNDPLFCGHGFILVHAARDGQKTIVLPDPAAETIELYSGKTWPAGTSAVSIDMKLGDNILLFQK